MEYSSVPNIIELPARIAAVRTADVRARVDGIVEQKLYQEGSWVAVGTPLFQIDPRDKRAQLQQAEASLQLQEAAAANAASVVGRYTPLVERRAVSQQEYDAAVSAARQTQAQIAQARAAVDQARLQLGYTLVRAPISGQVGSAQVTEGALVSASGATLLTQVNQLTPVYAVFNQSSAALLSMRQQMASGQIQVPSLSKVNARLIMENDQDYGTVGNLDFADMTVDPSTGTQILRAVFPNEKKLLLPGQFVRVRIEAGYINNGFKLPQRCIQIADEQATVFVVSNDGIANSRVVKLGAQDGSDWVILSGLKPKDIVIVDGWQKIQTGQKVNPVRSQPAPAGK